MNEAGWALPAVAAAHWALAIPGTILSAKTSCRQALSGLELGCRLLIYTLREDGFGLPSCASRAATKLQNTRLTASGLTHIWRLTAADAASFEGSAFVSCLFLVGTTDARNQSNRGRKRVGSLTLSV